MYLTNNTAITKRHALLTPTHLHVLCYSKLFQNENSDTVCRLKQSVLDIILQTIHRPFDALLHTQKNGKHLPK